MDYRYHLAIGSHLPVLEAWGFSPRTVFTWDKEIVGLGRGFARDVTEHIVLALRGDVPGPDHADRPHSRFSIRKSRVHSDKPDWAEQHIERWLPGGAFVSLFEVVVALDERNDAQQRDHLGALVEFRGLEANRAQNEIDPLASGLEGPAACIVRVEHVGARHLDRSQCLDRERPPVALFSNRRVVSQVISA
jgi:hypothetical protein